MKIQSQFAVLFFIFTTYSLLGAEPVPFKKVTQDDFNREALALIKKLQADKKLRLDLSDFQRDLNVKLKPNFGGDWKKISESLTAEVEEMYRKQLKSDEFWIPAIPVMLEALSKSVVSATSTIAFNESKFAGSVGTYYREKELTLPPDTTIALLTVRLDDPQPIAGYYVSHPEPSVVLDQLELVLETKAIPGYKGTENKLNLRFKLRISAPVELSETLSRKYFGTTHVVCLDRNVYLGREAYSEGILVHELKHLLDAKLKGPLKATDPSSFTVLREADDAYQSLLKDKSKEVEALIKWTAKEDKKAGDDRTVEELEKQARSTLQKNFIERYTFFHYYYRNPTEVSAFRQEDDYLITRRKLDATSFVDHEALGYWFTKAESEDRHKLLKKIFGSTVDPFEDRLEQKAKTERLRLFTETHSKLKR